MRDPWEKREQWRKHPVFTKAFHYRHMAPGLGWGLAAFAVYVAFDQLTHPSNIEKLKEDARKQRGEIS